MIGVALVGVAAALGGWTLIANVGGGVAAAYAPEVGDDLAEVEVAEAGPLLHLPQANGRELDLPVHGHSPACQLAVARHPERSDISRMGENGTFVTSIDPVCRARFLADGRFVATVGFGEGDLRTSVFDPRDLAADPLPLPDDIGQLYLGARSAVVGVTDDAGQVLVSVDGPDARQSIDLLDVDTGERQRLLDHGTFGEGEARVASAHLHSGNLVVVTAEPGAVGGEAIPWVGHRLEVPTQMWFGPVDGEVRRIRQMAELPPVEGAPGRTLLPPRIIDGPEGPLIVSLETNHQIEGQWDVVVTSSDGSTRIVGRLPGRTADHDDGDVILSIGRIGGAEGGSLDAAGTQVLIAGAAVGSDGPASSQPIGLVLDLADGSWYRLPEPVTAAGFVRVARD